MQQTSEAGEQTTTSSLDAMTNTNSTISDLSLEQQTESLSEVVESTAMKDCSAQYKDGTPVSEQEGAMDSCGGSSSLDSDSVEDYSAQTRDDTSVQDTFEGKSETASLQVHSSCREADTTCSEEGTCVCHEEAEEDISTPVSTPGFSYQDANPNCKDSQEVLEPIQADFVPLVSKASLVNQALKPLVIELPHSGKTTVKKLHTSYRKKKHKHLQKESAITELPIIKPFGTKKWI